MTRRNNMRGLAMIVALFMCTACGQASTPSAPSTTDAPSTSVTTVGLTTAYTVPENIETTTTTVAEVTTEAQREEETEAPETEVKEPETTAVETEVTTDETTMIVAIETTGKVEDVGEAKAPETEATTEETTEETTVAETEAKAVDRSSLPSEAMLDVQCNGKGNSNVVASVLVYYGIDCTSADVAGADDVAAKDVDGMISVINSFIGSNGGGYEAVNMSGYTMLDIAAEIVNGNPVFYWTDREFGAIYGYLFDPNISTGESDYYSNIDSKGREGELTAGPFYEDEASPIGCPAIVIHKK